MVISMPVTMAATSVTAMIISISVTPREPLLFEARKTAKPDSAPAGLPPVGPFPRLCGPLFEARKTAKPDSAPAGLPPVGPFPRLCGLAGRGKETTPAPLPLVAAL